MRTGTITQGTGRVYVRAPECSSNICWLNYLQSLSKLSIVNRDIPPHTRYFTMEKKINNKNDNSLIYYMHVFHVAASVCFPHKISSSAFSVPTFPLAMLFFFLLAFVSCFEYLFLQIRRETWQTIFEHLSAWVLTQISSVYKVLIYVCFVWKCP